MTATASPITTKRTPAAVNGVAAPKLLAPIQTI